MSSPAPPRTSFSPAKQTHWILDFDGTITEKDTLGQLVNIAAAGDLNTLSTWATLVDQYSREYDDYFTTALPSQNAHTSVSHEEELLEALRPVEQRSLARVFASKIFEGISGPQLQDGAWNLVHDNTIKLRTGCTKFLVNVSGQGAANKLDIISLNWSSIFVDSCIRAACQAHDVETGVYTLMLDTLPEVYSNELEGIFFDFDHERSTGEITSRHAHMFLTASDKLRQMKHIRDDTAAAQCIYIGDGCQDLLCLLEADFGICCRDKLMSATQQSLADALTRLDIDCQHIYDWSLESTSKIWWARDFDEITRWWKMVAGAAEERFVDDDDGDGTIIPTTDGNGPNGNGTASVG